VGSAQRGCRDHGLDAGAAHLLPATLPPPSPAPLEHACWKAQKRNRFRLDRLAIATGGASPITVYLDRHERFCARTWEYGTVVEEPGMQLTCYTLQAPWVAGAHVTLQNALGTEPVTLSGKASVCLPSHFVSLPAPLPSRAWVCRKAKRRSTAAAAWKRRDLTREVRMPGVTDPVRYAVALSKPLFACEEKQVDPPAPGVETRQALCYKAKPLGDAAGGNGTLGVVTTLGRTESVAISRLDSLCLESTEVSRP
jgi:hypothetical protein